MSEKKLFPDDQTEPVIIPVPEQQDTPPVDRRLIPQPVDTVDTTTPIPEPQPQVDENPPPPPVERKLKHQIIVPIRALEQYAKGVRDELPDEPFLALDALNDFAVNSSLAIPVQAYAFMARPGKESDIGQVMAIRHNTITDIPSGSVLRGEAAVRAMSSAKGGTYRLKLLSSGFYILMRKPSLELLDTIFNSLDLTMSELGKVVGHYRHTFRHAKFYDAVMMGLRSVTTYSNFVDWQDDESFFEAIRYSDIPDIIWTMCILSGIEKYSLAYVCPKDKHVTELELDVSTMRRIRKSLKPEAIEWMASDTKRTKEDLETYRAMVHLTEKIPHGNDTLHLEEPSIRRYLEVARFTIDSIMNSLEGPPSIHRREVWNRLQLHLHHGVLPWITKIILKSIDNKTLTLEGDTAARGYLDDIVGTPEFDVLMDNMAAAISSFEQTIICHVPPVCEQCKHSTPDIEYYVWDPSMAFQITTYQRLALSGLQLTEDSQKQD